MTEWMQAMVIDRVTSVATDDQPLRCARVPVPEPAGDEVRIAVRACGVCHTELDEIEGRARPPSLPVVPGHEIVGLVDAAGPDVTRHRVGERVGVGWIHDSDGTVHENLAEAFRATGRDANGGYAPFMIVGERYAYPIPSVFSDAEAAPLLCAGAIGYRALKLAALVDGERLGLTGFGASAHLLLQFVRHRYPATEVAVFARDRTARAFARELGAEWVGDTEDVAPWPLDVIVDTTPAWTPVVAALGQLAPGGRLIVNAIRKEPDDRDALLRLSYREHLWMERRIQSVANITAADIAEYLPLAAEIPIRAAVQTYPLSAANEALTALKRRSIRGAIVLHVDS